MSQSQTEQRKTRLEQLISQKQSELQSYQDDPQTQVDTRLSELSEGIEQTEPHDTRNPDNRSMHEHLTKLKEGLEYDPDAWVQWQINELESEINELQTELGELE